ncbi:hypothetical protein A2U01_0106140, partial [Trifolium medium]|nr:hypothetical protein [Trifolium medium]
MSFVSPQEWQEEAQGKFDDSGFDLITGENGKKKLKM